MNDVSRDPSCKRSLKKLQEKYVLVLIDKATGNVAFICKRFYASVLLKEWGLIGANGSPTYEYNINNEKDNIIRKNKKDLSKIFKLELPSDCETLPHIYWLPKLHKNPTKLAINDMRFSLKFQLSAQNFRSQPKKLNLEPLKLHSKALL